MANLPEQPQDLTIVYYTANTVPTHFANCIRANLVSVTDGIPKVWVSKEPLPKELPGVHLIVDTFRSHFNIYRDALTGAKTAKTKYIALCEDDVLYSAEHFKYRPNDGKFAYNLGAWSIFTWHDPPMFTHKGKVRRNLNSLICERELFIEAMEERFKKRPDPNNQHLKDVWAEPGKYERQLGVTVRQTEEYYANPPNIIFSHENELSFAGLGKRKRIGEFRALEIPYWGKAENVLEEYR